MTRGRRVGVPSSLHVPRPALRYGLLLYLRLEGTPTRRFMVRGGFGKAQELVVKSWYDAEALGAVPFGLHVPRPAPAAPASSFTYGQRAPPPRSRFSREGLRASRLFRTEAMPRRGREAFLRK